METKLLGIFSEAQCARTAILFRLPQSLVQDGLDVRLVRQTLLCCLLARQFNIVFR
jgi:hypothetical protein